MMFTADAGTILTPWFNGVGPTKLAYREKPGCNYHFTMLPDDPPDLFEQVQVNEVAGGHKMGKYIMKL